MSFEIDIPLGAQRLLQSLMVRDHTAYVVGGCVRDSLLCKEPHDWDICTSAKPEKVCEMLCEVGVRTIETGLQHGTVTACLGDGDYEITTYRVDGEYTDGRHPDKVEFVDDISADLARRDFTINAMAYNDYSGLVDPYGGWSDLNDGIIRCAGNPDDRFTEDALRILRALRFASTYGFKIEEGTADSIHRNRWLLKRISAERIQSELVKMLCGKGILDILLEYSDVVAVIIPELEPCIGFDQNNKFHIYTVYDHIAHAVSNYTGDDISVKIALLLHDIGKPQCYTEDSNGGHFYGHAVPSRDIAEKVLNRLKFDNKTKNEVLELVLFHDATIAATKKTVRRWLNMVGYEQLVRLMEIRRADILAHAPGTTDARLSDRDKILEIANEVIAEQECFQIKDLAVNGYDIMSLGVPSGPTVGSVLKHLLEQVLDENIENEHDALMEEAEMLLRIADEFCKIGCTSFRLTSEEIKELIKNGKVTSDKEEPDA